MDGKKVLSISTIRRQSAGEIDIDGITYSVLQMDFATHQLLDATDGTAESISSMRKAVAEVLPSLPEATLMKLTIENGQQILALSGGGIAAVERMFPNALRPETSTSPA